MTSAITWSMTIQLNSTRNWRLTKSRRTWLDNSSRNGIETPLQRSRFGLITIRHATQEATSTLKEPTNPSNSRNMRTCLLTKLTQVGTCIEAQQDHQLRTPHSDETSWLSWLSPSLRTETSSPNSRMKKSHSALGKGMKWRHQLYWVAKRASQKNDLKASWLREYLW